MGAVAVSQAPAAFWRLVARLLMLLTLVLVAGLPAISRGQPDNVRAWALMQEEPVVVLFRHAYAPGVGDPPNFRLGDCATQRVLNEQGRQQAKAIGQAFRDNNIHVGKVLSSQWCRAYDSANLAFPGQVAEAPAFNSFFQRGTGSDQTEKAMDILRNWQGPGVLVVFTHQVNITSLTDIFPASAQAVVLKPAANATPPLQVLATLSW